MRGEAWAWWCGRPRRRIVIHTHSWRDSHRAALNQSRAPGEKESENERKTFLIEQLARSTSGRIPDKNRIVPEVWMGGEGINKETINKKKIIQTIWVYNAFRISSISRSVDIKYTLFSALALSGVINKKWIPKTWSTKIKSINNDTLAFNLS